MVFGVPRTADFPEQTSYKLPELYGMWSFVFKINSQVYPEYFDQRVFRSYMAQISHKSGLLDLDNDGNDEVIFSVRNYTNPTESLPFGIITCETIGVETEKTGPECKFDFSQGLFGGLGESQLFKFPLGGLGATRLFGETLDGHTFEAFKVDSTEYQSR